MVEISCAPDLPAIWADHDRLEQVFVNLLGNAVGHNPPGTPVMVGARPAGQMSVAIAVTDEGIGLPAEVAAAPFEPRRSRARTAGAGLGLSIARGIVAAHGGMLRVVPSQAGASFEVRLPVEDNSVLPSSVTHGAGPQGHAPPVAGPPGGRPGGQNGISSLSQPTRPDAAGPRKEAGRS
jgi:signal transduction histidine kinase